MHSLYDVFCAIRADEGDHVSAMNACLDPEATIRSPSLEKRILAGAALAAAVGFLLSTGEMVDVGGEGVLEDGSAVTIIESVVAGIASFAQGVTSDGAEENVAGLGAEIEAGTAQAFIRQIVADIIAVIL
jgi:hypothetical protein